MALTPTDIADATNEELEQILFNQVYKASLFIEKLESTGRIDGNGHHAAQTIAENARADLKSRWRPPTNEPTKWQPATTAYCN